jgi:mono/diheme cytochrome c family protein
MRALLGCCLAILIPVSSAAAQEGQAFFDENCSVCHSIGGEAAAGPDLRDITKKRDRAWLARFILDPHEVARADAIAAALVKQYDDVMPPTEGASPETIEAVLRYIEQKSAALAASPPAPAAPAAETATTPVDVALGAALYEGRHRLARGGPACLSCHDVAAIGGLGGGTLGPDLNGAFRKLGGARGLTAWLGNPPTPVMRAVYRPAAIEPQEARALAAFLGEPSPQPAVAPAITHGAFAAIGTIGWIAILLAMGGAWAGRFRAARKPLVARARTEGRG